MEDLKPVYIVSLGPGEAGLISLIGGATLCRANAIFCPKTNARSRSSVLLKELKIKKESSGLQQSRQTQRTHFLSDVELIMQSVWKAA